MRQEAYAAFTHRERRADRRRGITIEPYGDMAIVVPCYNEAERFNAAAFEEFLNRYKDINFVFAKLSITSHKIGSKIKSFGPLLRKIYLTFMVFNSSSDTYSKNLPINS